jgi:NTE family protein
MATALVLAGAVAKGAFEAGVLSVLVERRLEISAVVATSAGALNAALFATGVRLGRGPRTSAKLLSLWREDAHWTRIVQPTWRGLVGRTGLSSVNRLEELVLRGMEDIVDGPGGAVVPIDLKLVTTSLDGEQRAEDGVVSTTFERVLQFSGPDFDSREGRERIARAALASAAFPILFVPADVPGVGPCVDGGMVNNAPISWALDTDVEHVIVVTGEPQPAPAEPEHGGVELVGKEVDIAINERLFRDLRQARRVNRKLEAVRARLQELPIDDAAREHVLDALGWRLLRITEIRPGRPLRGNAFSALSDPSLRQEYLQVGREAARRALDESGA